MPEQSVSRLRSFLDSRLRPREPQEGDGSASGFREAEDRAENRRPPLVVVPMANSPEVIGAIDDATRFGLARFVLIGPEVEITRSAESQGVDLSGVTIVEERDPQSACDLAATMASRGEAQVAMKGLVQTADFVRAFLKKEHALVADGLISHVALCDVPGYDRLFLITDSGITTYPDAGQKRQLVLNALACATALGFERPRVAMIAPVEKVSEKVPSTIDAAEVVRSFAGDTRLWIDGPFALDVAIRPEAARVKGIGGEVAGRADIIVTPSIDAGNVLYKSLTGFAGSRMAGIAAGASVPIVLTSRADSEEARIDSLRFALAASPRVVSAGAGP